MRLIFYIFILFPLSWYFQDNVLTIAKSMPEFVGGNDALANYLQKNIIYPVAERDANISGKTFVNFIVDSTGKIISPKIIKSSGNKHLDEEALRVVSSMPKWIPGSDSLGKVAISMNLPINFKLKDLGVIKAESKLTSEQQEKHEKAMKYWNEGHNFEKEIKLTNGLDKFNEALKFESENKYAMFDKGKVLLALGKKEEACKLWVKMIELSIRKDEVQEYMQKYCNNPNGQMEIMKLFYDIKAKNFFVNGMEQFKNGRYEAALTRLDSCLKYNSEHKDASFNKGITHDKLGQKRLACESWKKLLMIAPEDKETESLISKKCN